MLLVKTVAQWNHIQSEEFLDIPSDNESVDGLCDTDSESVTSEENFNSRVSGTEFDHYQETLAAMMILSMLCL